MKSSVGGAAANVVMTHAFPEMEPGMLRFSGKLIIASLLALALPSASRGQTTFPTANGSSVPGAVMMCVDSATGLAAPVLVSGSTCPSGGGSGGGGAITAASGAYAAGSIASGAFASGALASGSIAAGAMVDFLTVRGTKAPGTAAANSALTGCLYTSAGVTQNDGQQAAIGCTASNEVRVSGVGLADNLTFSTGTQTFSGTMGLAQTTAGGTGGALTDGRLGLPGIVPATRALRGDVTSVAGTAVDTNSGNKSAGTFRNVLATDQLALATWGQGANGATAPTSSTQEGCRSASTAPTEVTDGQMTPIQCGLGGKQIVMPFTVKELAARGKGTATASTGATTIITAGSGSNKTYVTDWECSNTSATNVTVTFNDSASTQIIVPATGGNNKGLQIPLVTAAATAFTFASDTSVTSVICNAQGYYAL